MPIDPLAERESRFCGRVFCNTAGLVVACFERDCDRTSVRSLYVRDPISRQYERLPTPDNRTSYQEPVAPRGVPYVYFNVMVNTDGGGDWLHVARVHLPSLDVEIVLTPGDLVASLPYLPAGLRTAPGWPMTPPWVSHLMQASDDGRILTCIIGVPEEHEDGRGGYRMNYGIFDLDVTTRSVRHLAALDTPSR